MNCDVVCCFLESFRRLSLALQDGLSLCDVILFLALLLAVVLMGSPPDIFQATVGGWRWLSDTSVSTFDASLTCSHETICC